MSKKLQCSVPESINQIIKALQFEKGTKGKALKELLNLALSDQKTFIRKDEDFPPPDNISCTLTISDEEWAKQTLSYRVKYDLLKANTFFRQALEHGAQIYKNKNSKNSSLKNSD